MKELFVEILKNLKEIIKFLVNELRLLWNHY